jgi:copper chaperone CopZ
MPEPDAVGILFSPGQPVYHVDTPSRYGIPCQSQSMRAVGFPVDQEEMMERIVKIDGMTCDGCVGAIEKEVSALTGIDLCAVKIGWATITTCLSGPEQVLELEQSIIQAVNKAGYKVQSIALK